MTLNLEIFRKNTSIYNNFKRRRYAYDRLLTN